MDHPRVQHGLIQKAKLDAQRFRILMGDFNVFVVWFRSDFHGWYRLKEARSYNDAVEIACEECAKLAEPTPY